MYLTIIRLLINDYKLESAICRMVFLQRIWCHNQYICR